MLCTSVCGAAPSSRTLALTRPEVSTTVTLTLPPTLRQASSAPRKAATAASAETFRSMATGSAAHGNARARTSSVRGWEMGFIVASGDISAPSLRFLYTAAHETRPAPCLPAAFPRRDRQDASLRERL